MPSPRLNRATSIWKKRLWLWGGLEHPPKPVLLRREGEGGRRLEEPFFQFTDRGVEGAVWSFIDQRYTFLAFCFLFLFIGYNAFFRWDDTGSSLENLKMGGCMSAVVFMTLGMLVFPSGPFVYPSPLFWRLVFGAGVVYLLAMVSMLFQPLDTARWWVSLLDPDLNQPPVYKEYAGTCDLTWETVKPAILDRFVLAHFLGWVAKSMLIRSRVMCWFISCGWELLEISLIFMLPNFAECWWDSWILDVLICNGLGIEVGYRLCRYLQIEQYYWSGVFDSQTLLGKLRRTFVELSPPRFTTLEWESFESVKRFVAANTIILFIHVSDTNAFFLKHLLWIPSEHSFNVYRIILWSFICIPAIRQLYIFIVDPECKKLGSFLWVGMAVLVSEVMVVFKFSRGQFDAPPTINVVCWVFLAGGFVLFSSTVLLHRKEFPDSDDIADARLEKETLRRLSTVSDSSARSSRLKSS